MFFSLQIRSSQTSTPHESKIKAFIKTSAAIESAIFVIALALARNKQMLKNENLAKTCTMILVMLLIYLTYVLIMVSECNLTRIQTCGRSTVLTVEYEPCPLKNADKLIFYWLTSPNRTRW